jgi:hypothetical protein
VSLQSCGKRRNPSPPSKAAVILAVGNPTDPNSHFAEVCKPGSGLEVQQISANDTPVYTGEPVPEDILENLVDPSWVEDLKREGVNDPRFVARVLGEFPKVSSDSLIQPDWIEAAQKRSLPRTRKPRLGIDVARLGEDESVIMQREGRWARAAMGRSQAVDDGNCRPHHRGQEEAKMPRLD